MKIRTILPLLELDSNEVIEITEQQAEEYQRVLSLAQKACVQSILQKVITSAKLKKIYVDEKCISIEIQRLSIKFSLNLYLFQFATCSGKMLSNLAEINIGKNESPEEIVLIIKETISQKINALMVGFSSEKLIQKIFKEMEEEKIILSFRKSFSGDDINGIDFFFSMKDWGKKEIEIPLQVKTSIGGQKLHQKKYPKIPSLYISEKDSQEEIKERIKEIGNAYKAFLKKVLHL